MKFWWNAPPPQSRCTCKKHAVWLPWTNGVVTMGWLPWTVWVVVNFLDPARKFLTRTDLCPSWKIYDQEIYDQFIPTAKCIICVSILFYYVLNDIFGRVDIQNNTFWLVTKKYTWPPNLAVKFFFFSKDFIKINK